MRKIRSMSCQIRGVNVYRRKLIVVTICDNNGEHLIGTFGVSVTTKEATLVEPNAAVYIVQVLIA